MADTPLPLPPTTTAHELERMFPSLTREQIKRVAAYGHVRSVRADEVLDEAGKPSTRLFIVKTDTWKLCVPRKLIKRS